MGSTAAAICLASCCMIQHAVDVCCLSVVCGTLLMLMQRSTLHQRHAEALLVTVCVRLGWRGCNSAMQWAASSWVLGFVHSCTSGTCAICALLCQQCGESAVLSCTDLFHSISASSPFPCLRCGGAFRACGQFAADTQHGFLVASLWHQP